MINSDPRARRCRRRFLLPAAVAASVVLAACGGGGDDTGELATLSESGGDTDTASETVDDRSDEEAALEFAACMRGAGVEDFPDPTVEADGSVGFGFGAGAGGAGAAGAVNPQDPGFLDAVDACVETLDGVAFGPGGGGLDIAEIEETLLIVSVCMRDAGFTDFPDPDLSLALGGAGGGDQAGGQAPGGGPTPFGDALDLDDPDFAAAFDECAAEAELAGLGGGTGQ